MSSTFGYMCFLIISKWLINWKDSSNAPSIITIFISLGKTNKNQNMYGDSNGEF